MWLNIIIDMKPGFPRATYRVNIERRSKHMVPAELGGDRPSLLPITVLVKHRAELPVFASLSGKLTAISSAIAYGAICRVICDEDR